MEGISLGEESRGGGGGGGGGEPGEIERRGAGRGVRSLAKQQLPY